MSDKLSEVLERQKSQVISGANQIDPDDMVQLVCFIVGEEEYAIPILHIKEIIKPIEYTRVPTVPNYVLGVFNLRGSVTPLIDLRVRFGASSIQMSDTTRYIVMEEGGNIAGFVIDKLTPTIRMRKDRIDQPPENLVKEKGFIEGIGKRDDNILTILKASALLNRDF